METKANYTVTGAFTLAVIFGVFGFIYWFQSSTGGGERSVYRIVFAGSVSGLRTGASVLFDGMRVGEVTQLALDPHDPRKVQAQIALDRGIPMRADTKVTLAFQGLTGLAEVSLTGGSADAALVTADAGHLPTHLCGFESRRRRHAGGARRALPHRRLGRRERNSDAHIAAQYRDGDHDAGARIRSASTRSWPGWKTSPAAATTGQIGQAADAIRKLADNLDKRTDEISTGLVHFSNSGLKEYEAFAVDGRRTLAELQKVLKNIDEHPSRLIFGH